VRRWGPLEKTFQAEEEIVFVHLSGGRSCNFNPKSEVKTDGTTRSLIFFIIR
jgi:hypothetical protein